MRFVSLPGFTQFLHDLSHNGLRICLQTTGKWYKGMQFPATDGFFALPIHLALSNRCGTEPTKYADIGFSAAPPDLSDSTRFRVLISYVFRDIPPGIYVFD